MKYPSIERDIIDFTNDTEVCNIGYNEGMIDSRPYRIEVWDSYGITSATIFMSTIDLDESIIKKILINSKIIDIIEDNIYITTVIDSNDNEFYSINVPLSGTDHEINKCLIDLKPFD